MMNFFMKKMMEKQLKNLPADQREKIMTAFEKDPKFFKDLADQIQHKVKKEKKDQQLAAMEVMMANKQKLQDLMK